MRDTKIRLLIVASLLAFLLPSLTSAQAFDETFDFRLDEWIEIELEEDPITIHRLRVVRSNPGVAARIARNERYDQQLELELEYSNQASRDWELDIQLEWLDEDDAVIEGIETEFELDKRRARDLKKEKSSANRYGLGQAVRLSVRLELDPD